MKVDLLKKGFFYENIRMDDELVSVRGYVLYRHITEIFNNCTSHIVGVYVAHHEDPVNLICESPEEAQTIFNRLLNKLEKYLQEICTIKYV